MGWYSDEDDPAVEDELLFDRIFFRVMVLSSEKW